ncbi:hypothetical protein HAALTHF_28290n [Vreelandella aquamarina]|nr:hypothetical protein HAALTHF_28290n [Halomonas axialensis]
MAWTAPTVSNSCTPGSFSRLPQHTRILWNDGPRLRELDAELESHGLGALEPGKGRNVWYCAGYVLASGRSSVVGLHDCDILTYDRSLLARLMYPVAHPRFNYRFCKGYYPRIAEGKLNGRVSRLMVTPLLRALKTVCGPLPYLDYLDSFRYPLSGEFAMRSDVLEGIRIPADWGWKLAYSLSCSATTPTASYVRSILPMPTITSISPLAKMTPMRALTA